MHTRPQRVSRRHEHRSRRVRLHDMKNIAGFKMQTHLGLEGIIRPEATRLKRHTQVMHGAADYGEVCGFEKKAHAVDDATELQRIDSSSFHHEVCVSGVPAAPR